MSLNYGPTLILGKRELQQALAGLPARVVKKIMDDWTLRQAKKVAEIARRNAPRDRNPKRNKPEGARLWRSIRATRVGARGIKRFPGAVSRAIAYSASNRGARAKARGAARMQARARKKNARRTKKAVFGPVQPGSKAYHFHLVALGTAPRTQRSTGRYTGVMPRNSFFSRSASQVVNSAQGEVGAGLRDAYERGIEREIKRLTRKHV